MTNYVRLQGRQWLLIAFALITSALMLVGFTAPQAQAATANRVVEDGVYAIESQLSGKVLDISGGSTTNRTNVQMYSSNSTAAQLWRVTYDRSTGHYTILNSLTGVSLDVQNGKARSGSNVQIYEANGTAAQQWDFVLNEDGSFTICSALDNTYVLDVSSANVNDYANVQIYRGNGTAAQKWNFSRLEQTVPAGLYTIASNKNTKQVLDVYCASQDNYAKILAWRSNGTNAQKWFFSYDKKTGFYTILSACSGKALDITNGSSRAGTRIQQYTPNGTKAQLWSVVVNEDGSYTVVSALSGQVLDLCNGETKNGTALQVWYPNGTAAQQWQLGEAQMLEDGTYNIASSLDESMMLDIQGGSLEINASTELEVQDSSQDQKWYVTNLGNNVVTLRNVKTGYYLNEASNKVLFGTTDPQEVSAQWKVTLAKNGGVTFVNQNSGRVIDLRNASTTAGTVIGTYAANGSAAQTWVLSETDLVDEGYYAIESRRDHTLVMDIRDGSVSNGGVVQIYESNGTDAQVWKVEKGDDGYYTIWNMNSGKVLDIKNGSSKEGATVQQYTSNGSAAQKWSFRMGEYGGVEIVSSLTGFSLTTRGDLFESGKSVTVASEATNSTFNWIFFPVSYEPEYDEAANIWNDPGYLSEMTSVANTYESKTNYFCTVDKSKGRTVVFQRVGSAWKPILMTDVLTTGHTFTGRFEVTHKARAYWNDENGINCNDWWVCFIEAWTDDSNGGVYRYYEGKGYDDGQGFHYGYHSGGCTVLPDYDAAKFIYDSVEIGSTVFVF